MPGAPSIWDVILLAVSSVPDPTMMPVERCGRRGLCAVQGPVGHAFLACSMGPGVPSMFDSLEVKVLCPGLVRQRASEAQGRVPRGPV